MAARWAKVLLRLALPLVLLALRGLAAQERPAALDRFLTRMVGLAPGELAALSRGETIARILPTANDLDVAVFGIVHVTKPRATFVQRQRDVPRALRMPTRSDVGVFGTPPRLEDVAAVQVAGKDLDELRQCQPNECNFKLPATDMARLRTTIDWPAPDAGARVTEYVRQRIVEYVTAYRERGNAALVVYDDNGGVHASDALVAMLRDSTYVFRMAPSLGRHLVEYPTDSLAGAAETIYWSLDNLPHVRRVLRILHETMYSPPELPGTTMIATKQIYADHYFEAGVEILTAVDDSVAASGGFTLVAVRHYRFDHLPRGGLLNLRGRVIDGLRDNVRADLARMKRDIEAVP